MTAQVINLYEKSANRKKTMTAQVINLYEKPKVERWCSFCKRKESQVPKMVSNSAEGNHLRCICSDCIQLAHKKVHNETT